MGSKLVDFVKRWKCTVTATAFLACTWPFALYSILEESKLGNQKPSELKYQIDNSKINDYSLDLTDLTPEDFDNDGKVDSLRDGDKTMWIAPGYEHKALDNTYMRTMTPEIIEKTSKYVKENENLSNLLLEESYRQSIAK